MGTTHKIQYGDTMTGIAKKYGTTVDALAKANNISNPNLIIAGKTLTIPDSSVTQVYKDSDDGSSGNQDTGYVRGVFNPSDEYNTANGNATSAKDALAALGDAKWYYGTDADGNPILGDDVLNGFMSDFQNRDKFSYDFNTDALYQQYKDKYIKQAKMASADVMGQAAAMNGGYGSSYAQTVGNQAYQANLEQLNDVIPELYQLAYDKYNQEGQDLLNMISLLRGERENYYDRYNEDYTRKYNDMSYWTNQANALWERDYGKYSDDEAYKYTSNRDKIADEQWAKDYDLSNRQVKMEEEAFELQKAEYQKSVDETTYSSKGTSPSGWSYDNGSYSDAVVKQAQNFVGANADGKWGPNSTAAAKAAGYESLADVVKAMGGGGNPLANVPQAIIDNVQKLETEEQQAAYLANQGIDKETALAILGQYAVTPLTERNWAMVTDGGWNLFGIDKNAEITDGTNTYTLQDLRKKLQTTTSMSNKEINDYIKKLQVELGIDTEGWNPFK